VDDRYELDTIELIRLTEDLRDLGVEEFEYRGFRVRFAVASAPRRPETLGQEPPTATPSVQSVYQRLFKGEPPAFPGGQR
jgi:hypothetical protein